MRKATLNAVVDGLMFAVGVGVVVTGLMLWLAIGRGPDPNLPKWLWGLHRHGWGDVHLTLGIALTALAALHTLLHTSWISGMSRRLLGMSGWWAVLLGIVLGLVFLAGVYGWERVSVPQSEFRHRRKSRPEQAAPRRPRRRRNRGLGGR